MIEPPNSAVEVPMPEQDVAGGNVNYCDPEQVRIRFVNKGVEHRFRVVKKGGGEGW